LGCSGAVWLDADGDGRRTSARHYAEQIWQASSGDLAKMVKRLATYDRAVAVQAANLCLERGQRIETAAAKAILETAASETRAGFRAFLDAHRKTVRARFD